MLLRALATATAAWIVCVLVVAATDEGSVPWAARLGRSLPAAPIAAAIGVALTVSTARTRGELRALEALGRSERDSVLSAVVGSLIPCTALAVLALCTVLDVSSFFPRPDARKIHVRPDGVAFVDEERGLRIDPDGSFSMGTIRSAVDESLPRGARVATFGAVLFASIVFALAASRTPGPERRRSIVWATATSGASIALFQLSAAGRLPPLLGVAPQAALLFAWRFRYRLRDE
jgi:hypothetical protein